MRLEQFEMISNFSECGELERIELLAFYFSELKGEPEFTVPDFAALLVSMGYAKPNTSRLKRKISASKAFIKGSNADHLRLSVAKKRALTEQFPNLSENEEIVSDESLLPEALFTATRRQYLVRLAKQINASYENNIFDGATLLMRRLLEILVIQAFVHKGIEHEITESDGNYSKLKTLINKACSSGDIGLSADSKKSIDQFRELGNLSAHRITYSARQADIRAIRMEYRAVIEELLYKAGLTANES